MLHIPAKTEYPISVEVKVQSSKPDKISTFRHTKDVYHCPTELLLNLQALYFSKISKTRIVQVLYYFRLARTFTYYILNRNFQLYWGWMLQSSLPYIPLKSNATKNKPTLPYLITGNNFVKQIHVGIGKTKIWLWIYEAC